ncbi:MAG TPA: AEC family transporter [Candidatus Omnitrophota bacterium]|nr:AEC family transporter [Candidatus Omnitrophota bacterium]HPD84813.1 AEC family transporter [Candidatus Omnitrophota bacterium]HRZ03671.1 AEC family transporter [Candidatus Omnitrophota bacterium]
MNANLSFATTLSAVFQIFLMGAVGYILVKKKIVDDNGLNLLSGLVVTIFLPFFTFNQLIQRFNFQLYPTWWIFPLISFGITLSGFLVGRFLLILRRGVVSKKEFISLVAFQNSGYVPLLLVATMFPGPQAQELFIFILLFLIGFDLVFWSLGVWLLTRNKIDKFDLTNLLVSPLGAVLISLLLIALGLQRFIPDILLKPVKMLGDCALPLAMVVVGGNLARIAISEGNKKDISWVVLGKLLLLPLLALLFTSAFQIKGLIGFLIVLEAAVPSATSLSVVSRHYKTEDKFINQGIFFTYIASLITIPIFLSAYAWLVGF